MQKKRVLNSLISVGTAEVFLNEISNLVRNKITSYICFANVHMVMEGYQNPSFQKVINQATIAAPDGKPISAFLNYFEKAKQVRLCGMDFMPLILKQSEAMNQSVFFFGSTEEVLATLISKVRAEFPMLIVKGSYSPPFRVLTDIENSLIITTIKETAPDLVFVSLGCPKQEKWMHANRQEIGACLLGVGQAFMTYAGLEKRSPAWMHRFSLEWIYRLYLEPKRLWKRYLFTNSYFLLLTFKQVLRKIIASFPKQLISDGQKNKPAV